MLALALASGCVDRESPLSPIDTPDPGGPVVADLVHVRCEVDVASATLSCRPVEQVADGGALYDRIVGAQDLYVKLASSGTTYDSETSIFQSNVTLQNLLAQKMGTTDGETVEGAYVFFVQGPEVTSGSGSVSVNNPDGLGTFTSTDQPYFHFNQILSPYQVSIPKTWEFLVDPTVNTFTFLVYVSAPLQDEGVLLDVVWEGGTDSSWETPQNWLSSILPDSQSVVSIFPETMLEGAAMPAMSASDTILHLRVGSGSTLDLGGHELRVRGNADASGTIDNGTLEMSGNGGLLQGTVDALLITGSTFLQGSTTATGPVSVSGVLTTGGNPLSIDIP